MPSESVAAAATAPPCLFGPAERLQWLLKGLWDCDAVASEFVSVALRPRKRLPRLLGGLSWAGFGSGVANHLVGEPPKIVK